ncbi:MAG TPA: glutathione S-transferase family protein [Myxococcota bacterium]
MYKLYCSKGAGSVAPQVMLEEVGAKYEKIPIDLEKHDNQRPEYLAVNPLGQVPALELPDGTVMTESAAIVLQIGDSHPELGLIPPVGSAERARTLRWLVFMAANLYIAELRTYYADRFTTDPAGADGVQAAGMADAERYLAMLEDALNPGPFLLGDRYSAADIYLWMLATWFPPQTLEKFPRIQRLMEQVRLRPAVARVAEDNGIGA